MLKVDFIIGTKNMIQMYDYMEDKIPFKTVKKNKNNNKKLEITIIKCRT